MCGSDVDVCGSDVDVCGSDVMGGYDAMRDGWVVGRETGVPAYAGVTWMCAGVT